MSKKKSESTQIIDLDALDRVSGGIVPPKAPRATKPTPVPNPTKPTSSVGPFVGV